MEMHDGPDLQRVYHIRRCSKTRCMPKLTLGSTPPLGRIQRQLQRQSLRIGHTLGSRDSLGLQGTGGRLGREDLPQGGELLVCLGIEFGGPGEVNASLREQLSGDCRSSDARQPGKNWKYNGSAREDGEGETHCGRGMWDGRAGEGGVYEERSVRLEEQSRLEETVKKVGRWTAIERAATHAL